MTSFLCKTTEVWKALRPSLRDWAKSRGFKRLASSPPAYAQEREGHWMTIFAQGDRGGVDHELGGKFTLNIQIGQKPMPGVHVSPPVIHSTTRFHELLSTDERAEALPIHNAVVKKRILPPPSSYIHRYYDADTLRATFLTQLAVLPQQSYWAPFCDAGDVTAWGEFFAAHLDSWIEAVEGRMRVDS